MNSMNSNINNNYNNYQNNNEVDFNNIPFGWMSNVSQFSDIIHEIPLPVFRADSSINLVDSNSFTSTITLLHAQKQQQDQQQPISPIKDHNNVPINPIIPIKNSQQLINTVNLLIQNTNVSNIKMRADVPKPQTEPSTLLKAIYNQVPILKDKDRRVLSPLKNSINSNNNNNNNNSGGGENNGNNKYSYLNNVNATDINNSFNKENNYSNNNFKSNSEQQLQQQPIIQQPLQQPKLKKKKVKHATEQQLQQQQQQQQEQEKPIQKLFNLILQFFDTVKEDKDHAIINATFLENIGKEIQTCSKLGLLKDISLEKYAQLIQFLIRFAKEPNKISLSYNEKDQNFSLQYQKVEFALECCLLTFNLLTMPDISDQLSLLLEDQLIEILSSLKYQVFENIIGYLDPSFKNYVAPVLTEESTKEEKKSKKKKIDGDSTDGNGDENYDDDDGDDDGVEDYSDDDSDGEDESNNEQDNSDDQNSDENPYDKKPSKKKITKKSSKSTTNKKKNSANSSGKLSKFIILSNKVSEILERISWMIEKVKIRLSESFVSLLLDLCIPTLFIDGISFIQLSSISVVRNCFIKNPNQRQIILDEILPNLSKPILNSNKKISRVYKISKDKSIQNLSALLIQLIQGSIFKPSLDDLENYKILQQQQQQAKFSLKDAQKYSTTIILFFIEKCSEKTEEGEYRILLENFIQDLLIVFNHPEWPAANLILHLFSATVMHIVAQQKVDSNFRLVSIDLLGSVLTKLKQELVFSKDDTSLSIVGTTINNNNNNNSSTTSSSQQSTSSTSSSTSNSNSGSSSSSNNHDQKKKSVKCICNKYESSDSYSTIKCNECNSLFHDSCAPDFTKNGGIDQLQLWVCVSCQIKDQVVHFSTLSKITPNATLEEKLTNSKKHKKSSKNNKNEEDDSETLTTDTLIISEKEIYQQLVLNYLESRCSSESWIHSSRQFLIASWLDSTVSGPTTKDNLPIRKYFLSQWGFDNTAGADSDDGGEFSNKLVLPPQITQQQPFQFNKSFICSQEDAMKMIRKITISSGSVFQVANNLLYHLLSILFDPSTKARAKAMKSFTTIIEADPSILADEKVHSAIKNRFMDESISVREHTVDLIGKYVLIKPELTWRYIDLICDLINDKGISVRKRVVKTLNEICLNHMQHPKIPYLCRVLVTRVSDEEVIKDLVLKTFQDLWFSEKFYNETNQLINNNNNNNISNNPEILKVKQIIEVSKQLDQDSWFIDLIQKMLDRSNVNGGIGSTTVKKESKKKLEKEHNEVVQMSNKICSTLIEMLVSLDEKKTKNIQEYIGIFKTLNIFCKVNPSFLVPFATILHPYLKPMDPNQNVSVEESNIFIFITHILEKTLPLIEHNDIQFLNSIESDLVILIQKQSTTIVQSSIKCLCTIVEKCSFNYEILEIQLSKAIHILQTCQSGRTKGEIIRALFVSGLFIRYFDFEKLGCINASLKINIKPGEASNTLISITSKLFNFAKDKDVVSRSLESIGNVVISSPKILNKDTIKEVLAKSFSPNQTEPKIKEAIMKLFYDLLDKEMKQFRKPDSSEVKKLPDSSVATDHQQQQPLDDDSQDQPPSTTTKDFIVSMNIDEDSESLVSSVQKYFPSMIRFLLEPDQTIRLATISTIELIIRQGILNPLDSVPYIIALLTDPNRHISELAYKTLISLNQKHTSSLFKRVTESIKLTFKFHQDLNSKSPFNVVTKGMSKFYLLFKNSKSSRTTFLSTILTNFESIKEYRYKELSYFKFIFEILASLPYGNMDEVIVVINAIDKIISLNANFVQSKMITWSKEESNKKQATGSTSSSTTTTNTTTTGETTSLNDKPTYDKAVYKNFIMGMVVVYLLQLKKFILKTYSISKEKMKSYLDSETKDSDKLVTTFTESITFTDHNYPFSPLPIDTDLQSNVSVQKSIFNDLKSLLKDDDMDEFSIKVKSKPQSNNSNSTNDDSDSTTTTSKTTRKRKQTAPKEPKQPKSKPVAKANNSRKKKNKISSEEE